MRFRLNSGGSRIKLSTWLKSYKTLRSGGFTPFVFVHVPKTGGTSFRKAAEGCCNVCYDYGKSQAETSELVRRKVYGNEIDSFVQAFADERYHMMCGHFPLMRYKKLFGRQARYCAFLRDPVQRLISDYRDLTGQGYKGSLKELSETKANHQARLLAGLDLEKLFFFGITEEYEKSIKLFNKLSGLNLSTLSLNVRRERNADRWEVDPDTLAFIIQNNELDLQLYRKAKDLFEKRLLEHRI